MSNELIKLYDHNKNLMNVTYSTFPAGEEYVCLTEPEKLQEYKTYTIKILSADSITLMRACLLADAIKQHLRHICYINAELDYFPYGRQDRVCKDGESYSLDFIVSMLTLRFDSVISHDVHSKQTLQCLASSFTNKYEKLFENVPYIDVKTKAKCKLNEIFNKDFVVICPDKGAINRSKEFAQYIGSNKIVYLSKTRKDGKISVEIAEGDGNSLELIKESNNFVLSDDVIDGGNTYFVVKDYILKVNPAVKITLVFSHGIFSGGLEKINNCFENIYVVDDDYNNYRLRLLENK